MARWIKANTPPLRLTVTNWRLRGKQSFSRQERSELVRLYYFFLCRLGGAQLCLT